MRLTPAHVALFVGFAAVAALCQDQPRPPLIPGKVAFTVWDQRPEVLSGARKEEFTGLNRSLSGIPYGKQTGTKRPLAAVLGGTVEQALRKDGVLFVRIEVPPFARQAEVVEALKTTGADRLLLYEIRDWESDTLVRTELRYNVLFKVLNGQGVELAQASSSGEDLIGPQQRPERQYMHKATTDILRRRAIIS